MAIVYDSRKVKPGDTFVAIPGLKHDGIDFIPAAIEAGAKIIVAEKKVDVPAGVKLHVVPSARMALAQLSAEFYGNPSRKLKLIGITGTKGKTTVSYLIHSILLTAGFKPEIIGTISHKMTTPESADLQEELAKMAAKGVTHCILEVSSHALAQERVHACHFAVAIFTNFSHEHLDYHKTMENYLFAKRKLFEMLDKDALAIVNIDDPASNTIIEAVKGEVLAYSLNLGKEGIRSTKHAELDLDVSALNINKDEMHLKINSLEITTPLIGIHNAYNILAAFQCGVALGVGQGIIKKGIEKVKVISGRQEKIDQGQPFEIIVDFAHSPDSLQKLLETYKPLTKGKVILVFGCPGDRDRLKRPIMGGIAAKLADFTIITTDDPHCEEPESIIDEIEVGVRGQVIGDRYEKIADRRKAIKKALSIAKAGDIVLIAGRGHEKYQDFNGKLIEIDDRVVVKQLLSR